MDYTFSNCEQVSERCEPVKHVYPTYGKSTTDPTYYEPSATRIANMKKASGTKLEGIYDFYTKDDVEKFNEDNFKKYIQESVVDPRFNNKLLPEEVSQITTNITENAKDMIAGKNAENKAKKARIDEAKQINSEISAQSNNDTTE